MLYYRRRLPHWIPDDAAVFVTWRLAGSAPPVQPEILTAENTGRLPFLLHDQRMDSAAAAPFWLRDKRVAGVIENALLYGEGSPVKAGLVEAEERWPWSSARFKGQATKNDGLPHGL